MSRYDFLEQIEESLDRALNDLNNEEFERLLEDVSEVIKNYD